MTSEEQFEKWLELSIDNMGGDTVLVAIVKAAQPILLAAWKESRSSVRVKMPTAYPGSDGYPRIDLMAMQAALKEAGVDWI